MDNILIPTDPNDYLLLDTFNRASNDISADALTYSKANSAWATSGFGAIYKTLAAGYATPAAAGDADEVMGTNVSARPRFVSMNLVLATTGRTRILLRKTDRNVDRDATGASGMDCILILMREASNVFETRLQVVRLGVAEELLAWADHGTNIDPANGISVLLEDTGTQIKITANGITRSAILPDPTEFENNTYIGATIKEANTNRLSQLRAW